MKWRDWISGVGVLVGLAGIILAALFFLAGQTRVALELQLTSKVEFTAPGGPFSERTQLLLDGQEVDQVWISALRLTNTGNVDIRPVDFAEPVHFNTTVTQIKGVIPGESEPPGLPFKLSRIDENLFELDPLLIKNGESFAFSVISIGNMTDLFLSHRISGIDEIEMRSALESQSVATSSFTWITSLVAFSGLLTGASLFTGLRLLTSLRRRESSRAFPKLKETLEEGRAWKQ